MSEQFNFRTLDLKQENFLNLRNPDTQIKGFENVLMYNTGVYGSKIDNAYPDLLKDLYYEGSTVHQNLINLKSTMITGNNLQAENIEGKESLVSFIRKRNKAGDNLQDVYAKVAKDFALFEGAVLQCIFNRNGEVAEVYHVPTERFRLGIPDKYGQVQFGYLSPTWGMITNSIQQRIKDSVKIRMWDPTNWQKYPTQLIYIKNYSHNHYAVPTYSSSIPWVILDRELSDFHLNNVRSNFFLSMMITQVRGGMSEEQVQESIQELEKFYSGNKKRKVLFSFVDDINDKPVIDSIAGQEQDKLFETLSSQVFQSIVTAHRAFPVLGGFEGNSSDLGGESNKIITALLSFQNLVCDPMKQTLLAGFNRICEVNSLPGLDVISEPPKITPPIPGADDLTRNERRKYLYGLPPLDDSVNTVDNPNIETTEDGK